jgi:hypothetical protein
VWALADGGPSPNLAQFNRETYRFSTRLSLTTEARRYQVLVLSAADAGRVGALKRANPRLTVLVYQSLIATDRHDPSAAPTLTGCTSYTDDVRHHADWLLRDGHGAPVTATPHNVALHLTDIGDPGYEQRCAANAASLARAHGFDGVFFDMVIGDLSSLLDPGVNVPRYARPGSWSDALTAALGRMVPVLHAAGLIAVGNLALAPDVTTWEGWAGELDGVEEESWTDGGLGPRQQVPFFMTKLDELAWTQHHQEYELVHSFGSGAQANTYGLAAMLLVAAGTASYSTSNVDYSADEQWYSVYGTARRLGPPSGSFERLHNGVLERRFAHGLVLVNPQSTRAGSIALGGRYTGSGLTRVTTASLPATSGLILHADAGR